MNHAMNPYIIKLLEIANKDENHMFQSKISFFKSFLYWKI